MSSGAQLWTPKRIISRATAQAGERLERRKFARVKMELPGRYMTQDGAEFECVTIDFSPGGVCFRASKSPTVGTNVIAYVRDLGRVQGKVIRRMTDGFVLEFIATALKVDRLAQKIARLDPLSAKDRRLFPRLILEGASIALRCADGRNEIAPIIDVSESGIALCTQIALKVDERVEIGEQSAVVVRLFDGGAAARFI